MTAFNFLKFLCVIILFTPPTVLWGAALYGGMTEEEVRALGLEKQYGLFKYPEKWVRFSETLQRMERKDLYQFMESNGAGNEEISAIIRDLPARNIDTGETISHWFTRALDYKFSTDDNFKDAREERASFNPAIRRLQREETIRHNRDTAPISTIKIPLEDKYTIAEAIEVHHKTLEQATVAVLEDFVVTSHINGHATINHGNQKTALAEKLITPDRPNLDAAKNAVKKRLFATDVQNKLVDRVAAAIKDQVVQDMVGGSTMQASLAARLAAAANTVGDTDYRAQMALLIIAGRTIADAKRQAMMNNPALNFNVPGHGNQKAALVTEMLTVAAPTLAQAKVTVKTNLFTEDVNRKLAARIPDASKTEIVQDMIGGSTMQASLAARLAAAANTVGGTDYRVQMAPLIIAGRTIADAKRQAMMNNPALNFDVPGHGNQKAALVTEMLIVAAPTLAQAKVTVKTNLFTVDVTDALGGRVGGIENTIAEEMATNNTTLEAALAATLPDHYTIDGTDYRASIATLMLANPAENLINAYRNARLNNLMETVNNWNAPEAQRKATAEAILAANPNPDTITIASIESRLSENLLAEQPWHAQGIDIIAAEAASIVTASKTHPWAEASQEGLKQALERTHSVLAEAFRTDAAVAIAAGSSFEHFIRDRYVTFPLTVLNRFAPTVAEHNQTLQVSLVAAMTPEFPTVNGNAITPDDVNDAARRIIEGAQYTDVFKEVATAHILAHLGAAPRDTIHEDDKKTIAEALLGSDILNAPINFEQASKYYFKQGRTEATANQMWDYFSATADATIASTIAHIGPGPNIHARYGSLTDEEVKKVADHMHAHGINDTKAGFEAYVAHAVGNKEHDNATAQVNTWVISRVESNHDTLRDALEAANKMHTHTLNIVTTLADFTRYDHPFVIEGNAAVLGKIIYEVAEKNPDMSEASVLRTALTQWVNTKLGGNLGKLWDQKRAEKFVRLMLKHRDKKLTQIEAESKGTIDAIFDDMKTWAANEMHVHARNRLFYNLNRGTTFSKDRATTYKWRQLAEVIYLTHHPENGQFFKRNSTHETIRSNVSLLNFAIESLLFYEFQATHMNNTPMGQIILEGQKRYYKEISQTMLSMTQYSKTYEEAKEEIDGRIAASHIFSGAFAQWLGNANAEARENLRKLFYKLFGKPAEFNMETLEAVQQERAIILITDHVKHHVVDLAGASDQKATRFAYETLRKKTAALTALNNLEARTRDRFRDNYGIIAGLDGITAGNINDMVQRSVYGATGLIGFSDNSALIDLYKDKGINVASKIITQMVAHKKPRAVIERMQELYETLEPKGFSSDDLLWMAAPERHGEGQQHLISLLVQHQHRGIAHAVADSVGQAIEEDDDMSFHEAQVSAFAEGSTEVLRNAFAPLGAGLAGGAFNAEVAKTAGRLMLYKMEKPKILTAANFATMTDGRKQALYAKAHTIHSDIEDFKGKMEDHPIDFSEPTLGDAEQLMASLLDAGKTVDEFTEEFVQTQQIIYWIRPHFKENEELKTLGLSKDQLEEFAEHIKNHPELWDELGEQENYGNWFIPCCTILNIEPETVVTYMKERSDATTKTTEERLAFFNAAETMLAHPDRVNPHSANRLYRKAPLASKFYIYHEKLKKILEEHDSSGSGHKINFRSFAVNPYYTKPADLPVVNDDAAWVPIRAEMIADLSLEERALAGANGNDGIQHLLNTVGTQARYTIGDVKEGRGRLKRVADALHALKLEGNQNAREKRENVFRTMGLLGSNICINGCLDVLNRSEEILFGQNNHLPLEQAIYALFPTYVFSLIDAKMLEYSALPYENPRRLGGGTVVEHGNFLRLCGKIILGLPEKASDMAYFPTVVFLDTYGGRPSNWTPFNRVWKDILEKVNVNDFVKFVQESIEGRGRHGTYQITREKLEEYAKKVRTQWNDKPLWQTAAGNMDSLYNPGTNTEVRRLKTDVVIAICKDIGILVDA